ncbi:MAG: type III-B CRISPR-associated protein Cas10/Cmr2 [Saprospiraceae bacterium]|nr:type III-B CRISPR-associated protein Cas10/Cmr2 [Saprospiraceae bacterium]
MKSTYFTLTIGPIIGTLDSAQKTRELWASSYLFSYLIRELMKKLNANLNGHGEILLPAKNRLEEVSLLGAGLYPDRIYVKANEGMEEEVQKIIQNAIESVIKETSEKIYADFQMVDKNEVGKEGAYISPFSASDCLNCIKSYVKLYSGKVELDSGDNIIEALSSVADTMDLQTRILPYESRMKDNAFPDGAFPVDEDNRNPLQRLFYLANWSFLFEDGFGVEAPTFQPNEPRKYNTQAIEKLKSDENISRLLKLVSEKPKRGFDSLIEIASRELRHVNKTEYDKIIKEEIQDVWENSKDKNTLKDEDAAEERIINRFKGTYDNTFKDYHKYIAIIHADGDNVGKMVKAIGGKPEEIPGFSQALLDYSYTATEEVVRYGGAPVYMGGDDMLFFAPVCNRNADNRNIRKTIFDLLDLLDTKFKVGVADRYKGLITAYYDSENIEVEKRLYPTLSYGISITFYKFPLYEAKNMSYELLYEIKNFTKDKNAVNVKLMKHSGQTLPFLIPKDVKNASNLWKAFLDLVDSTNSSGEFLNSFTYKLNTLKPLITHAASRGNIRLHNLFKNSFNENYGSNRNFYNALVTFIETLYKYYGQMNAEQFELLYGALRFVHFIHNKSEQHVEVV